MKSAGKFALVLLGTLSVAGSALGAGTDDRSRALAIVEKVGSTPEGRRIAKEQLDRAKAALERARGARGAGDQTHGAMLEALALEWAECAEELVRTAALERQAMDIERKLADVEAKALRARTLIEQTAARRGRAQEKLKELEPQKREPAKPEAAKPEPSKPAATKPEPSKPETKPAPSKPENKPTKPELKPNPPKPDAVKVEPKKAAP